jgi:outer membrane protein assembly factor BamB
MRRTLLCCALFVFAFPARAEWHLQWKQTLPQRVAAWEFVPKMGRDTAYEITPVGSLAVVTTEFDGSVRAFDTASGREQWRFHTNGPIRSAAVAADDAIVVGSEDGFLYCLEQDGRLRWSVCGGPRERLVLGHGRLISAWPVAAKPAVHAGKVYFVAGYWPVNGIYHHAVDLKTGTIEWTNSAAQFRPFGVMNVADGVLTVTGHPSGGRYDITTGAAVAAQPAAATPPKDKTTVAEPRPAFPDASNVTFQVVRQAAGFAEAFVGTSQAEILCYRESPPAKAVVHEPLKPAQNAGEAAPRKIDVDAGYAILVNPTVATITAALQKPALHVIALVEQPEMARDLRTAAEAHGLYEGRRLDIRSGPIVAGVLPPYIASYVACEAHHAAALQECVRPYGGILAAGATTTRRSGSLPGADDWRQEFHDAANTLASRDTRIKTPLGTLWYGGDAADMRFYFDANVDHQSGDQINPQPVGARFVDGRMILQGPGLLGGFDMYTGRKLWETKLPLMFRFGGSGGGLGVHSKKYPKPWEHPEAVAAEVPVTQHCRASGFNMVALPDGVFVAAQRHILRFDPDSGRQLSAWPVPPALDETGLFWGGLHAEGNVLVASLFREQTMIDCQAGFDGQGGDFGGDRMPMAHLVAIDKTTGEILWTRKAVWGFLNRSGVALSSTRVFAVDACEEKVMAKLREAGRELPQELPSILALDLKTGKEIWKRDMDVLMRGLVYSAPRDLLLAANRHFTPWKDGGWVKGAKGVAGRMRALKGENGETAWETDAAAFFDPHIMLDDLIIDRQGVTYDLRTGERHRRTSPLTGTPEEWSFQKAGCNHLIACDTLVTWRCAVYDLAGQAGTLPLAGMDAGCTPTLVPAGGLLNIPNFGTHHKRNRMTAMALVHAPENAAWTRYEMQPSKTAVAPAPLKKAGFNLGAPGDRVAPDGTLWLAVGPRSGGMKVATKAANWFEVSGGDGGAFVGRTGAAGITDISIPLVVGGKAAPGKGPKMTVDVTLTFVEPESRAVGERVFSVSLAGQEAIKDLDIVKEAGGPRRIVTRTIRGVAADGVLPIQLTASVGEPVLSGIEIEAR